jgi:hypothetical protein
MYLSQRQSGKRDDGWWIPRQNNAMEDVSFKLTTMFINSEFDKAVRNSKACNDSFSMDTKHIHENERKNLNAAKSRMCPIMDMKRYLPHITNNQEELKLLMRKYLPSLKTDELEHMVHDEFYNVNVMEVMSCLSEAIFYTSVEQEGQVDANLRIADWFSDVKQIGGPSAVGTAMLSSLKDAGGMLVLKAPQDPKNTELLHELFIGSFGTNKARKDIPNFAYIYGGFECSYPIIDDDTGKVISLCGNPNGPKVQYVAYEAITSATSMNSAIKTITTGEFLSLFMQVFFATYYGYMNFDWTHGDLHGENVMVRDISSTHKGEFYIKYPMGNNDYYVQSNSVATFIDYGNSHIMFNGEHYGRTFCQGSLYPTKSFPISDIYKFLLFVGYHALQEKREDIIAYIARIFFFFNQEEDIHFAITEQRGSFYVLPNNPYVHKIFTMESMLNYLLELDEINGIVATKNDGARQLLDCTLICRTSQDAFQITGIDPKARIMVKSLVDYYDLRKIVSPEVEKDLRSQIDNNLDKYTDDFMEGYRGELEYTLKTYNILDKNASYFEDINYLKDDYIYSLEALESFKGHIIKLSQLKASISLLQTMSRVGSFMFNDLKLKREFNEVNTGLDMVIKTKSGYIRLNGIFKHAISFMEDKIRTPPGPSKLREYPELGWYLTKSKIYL